MDENIFWELIENANKQDSHKDFIQILEKELEQFSNENIIEFECILREKIIEANHYDIMGIQKLLFNYVSDDSYFDFRCQLISLGRDKYEAIIKNPDSISNYLDAEKGIDFPDKGDLFYISTKIFQKRTRREEDENFPRENCKQRGLNYHDSMWIKGEIWQQESELQTRLPKLWDKLKKQQN